MEEINLKELFDYLKNQILLIIIFILLPILLCIVYKTFLEKPTYESTTTIILAGFNTQDGNEAIDNSELTINQKLVSTYQQIAKSKEVLNDVITQLGIELDYATLQKKVTVSNVADTEIIRISVSDEVPETSAVIASKLADVFISKVQEIYNISNASVLDRAETPTKPSNMSLIKAMVISAFLGVVIGILFVTMLFYFDTTVKTAEQIESKFNVVVLGSIPDYNSKKKKKGDK